METYYLELTLLGMCMLAAVLWFVQDAQSRTASVDRFLQPDARYAPKPYTHPVPPQRTPAGSAGSNPQKPSSSTKLLTLAGKQSTELKLANAISALYAISRSDDHAAAKIAERTIPRLQDYREPKDARLTLAMHRLGIIALGQDAYSARVATQCLSSITSESD